MDPKLRTQLQGDTDVDIRRFFIWRIQTLLQTRAHASVESLASSMLRISDDAVLAAELEELIGTSEKARSFVRELLAKRQQMRAAKAPKPQILHNPAVVRIDATCPR